MNSSHVTQYISIDGNNRDEDEERGDRVDAFQIDGTLVEQQPPAVVVEPSVYHYRAPPSLSSRILSCIRNNTIDWVCRTYIVFFSFWLCLFPSAVLQGMSDKLN